MKELIVRLNAIPNSYFDFISGVVSYAKGKEERYALLMGYLDSNPSASVSDVIKFISDQPDFFDDNVAPRQMPLMAG